jgi:hypothetical protein
MNRWAVLIDPRPNLRSRTDSRLELWSVRAADLRKHRQQHRQAVHFFVFLRIIMYASMARRMSSAIGGPFCFERLFSVLSFMRLVMIGEMVE